MPLIVFERAPVLTRLRMKIVASKNTNVQSFAKFYQQQLQQEWIEPRSWILSKFDGVTGYLKSRFGQTNLQGKNGSESVTGDDLDIVCSGYGFVDAVRYLQLNPDKKVRFFGCFDALVAGDPSSAQPRKSTTDLDPQQVPRAFHAMSMDELRESFFLKRIPTADGKEVWFRGGHEAVTGDPVADGVFSMVRDERAELSLWWMIDVFLSTIIGTDTAPSERIELLRLNKDMPADLVREAFLPVKRVRRGQLPSPPESRGYTAEQREKVKNSRLNLFHWSVFVAEAIDTPLEKDINLRIPLRSWAPEFEPETDSMKPDDGLVAQKMAQQIDQLLQELIVNVGSMMKIATFKDAEEAWDKISQGFDNVMKKYPNAGTNTEKTKKFRSEFRENFFVRALKFETHG